MNLSRRTTWIIRWVLDELIPPALRDSWLLLPLFIIVYGKRARHVLTFKERLFHLHPPEIRAIYEDMSGAIQRETDCTAKCLERILRHVRGESVLEVGAGRGYLSKLLCDQNTTVTVCDFVIDKRLIESRRYKVVAASADALPFATKSFDTVICAHTLEHVLDIRAAISELRRVSRRRIIVLPCQRPYRLTFDLHIHFFPYEHDVLLLFNVSDKGVQYSLEKIDGDWFYVEDDNIGWAK